MPQVPLRNPDAPLQVGIVETALPASSPRERDFADFYREAYPTALLHARRQLRPPADAEVAQQAAIVLWRRWDQLALPQRTVAFFLGIVNNCIRDERRRSSRWQHRHVSLDRQLPSGAAYGESTELARELRVAEQAVDYATVCSIVEGFPKKERDAWQLCRVEGFTAEEAARKLNRSAGTVRKQVSNAGQRIRRQLEGLEARLGRGSVRGLLTSAGERDDD